MTRSGSRDQVDRCQALPGTPASGVGVQVVDLERPVADGHGGLEGARPASPVLAGRRATAAGAE